MAAEHAGARFFIKAFHADDSARMEAAHKIRAAVFCDEQGVPADLEWDGNDHLCEHILLELDGTAIGTARVRPYGPSIFKVERVAVLKHMRGQNAGKAIMDYILGRMRGTGTVVLNAQAQVEVFYQRLGFTREGEVFQEAGIDHVHMVWRP